MDKILDLMKRMGENIPPMSFWDKMIDERPIFLKEGLITSYSGEMVLNAICDSFHLRRNGKTPKISLEPLRGVARISFVIGEIRIGNLSIITGNLYCPCIFSSVICNIGTIDYSTITCN